MKSVLAATLRYLAKTLLYLAVLAGFMYAQVLVRGQAVPLATLIHDFLSFAPLALYLALMSSMFHLLRLDKGRMAARGILFILSTGATFGLLWTWQVLPTEAPVSSPVSVARETGLVYAGPQGYEAWTEAANGGHVWLRGRRGGPLAMVPSGAPGRAIVELPQAPEALGDALAFWRGLMGRFYQAPWGDWWSWWQRILFPALLVVASWTLVRMSRWPLFNLLVVLVFHAGLVALSWVLAQGPWSLILEGIHPMASSLAIPVLLSLVSLVLLILPFFMPPFKDWKRQVQG